MYIFTCRKAKKFIPDNGGNIVTTLALVEAAGYIVEGEPWSQPVLSPNPDEQAQEVALRFTADLRRLNKLENLEFSRSVETGYSLLADVEFAIEELRYVLLLANDLGNDVPCILEEENTVPIVALPLSAALLRQFPLDYFPYFAQVFREERFRENLFVGFPKIAWFKPSEVSKMVFSPLKKFLKVRFQWIADNPEFRSLGAASSAQANTPYLPFTVRTNTSGLRIHYSNTFAISFNNVFGAPTTPSKGWILPGIHKFAGMDRSGRYYYDQGTFTTPPSLSATLMI